MKEGDKTEKISEDIYKHERKLSKLVELNIDGVITKEDYESKYTHIIEKIEKLKVEQKSLDGDYDEQEGLREKINSFKNLFNNNQLLTEFDREIFENVIDKVIIGKVDESGIRNLYSVTFVFKTGGRLHSKKVLENT